MKFTVFISSLIDSLKLAKGFVGKSERRHILKTVHVSASSKDQTMTIEATDSARAVRWSVDAKVEQEGECIFEITNYLLVLLKAKSKKPYDIEVTIYEDNNCLKADIDNNIIVLNEKNNYDQYPKMSGVYDADALDVQPKIDIHMLQASLKAMENAGAAAVILKIGKDENKKIKLVASSEAHLNSREFEVVMCPLRKI